MYGRLMIDSPIAAAKQHPLNQKRKKEKKKTSDWPLHNLIQYIPFFQFTLLANLGRNTKLLNGYHQAACLTNIDHEYLHRTFQSWLHEHHSKFFICSNLGLRSCRRSLRWRKARRLVFSWRWREPVFCLGSFGNLRGMYWFVDWIPSWQRDRSSGEEECWTKNSSSPAGDIYCNCQTTSSTLNILQPVPSSCVEPHNGTRWFQLAATFSNFFIRS